MITLDLATDATAVEPGTTRTFSHTIGAGSNKLLVVQVVCYGANRATSGVTYNAVAMTLAKQCDGNNINVSIWHLFNPTIGANNVVITQPAACDGIAGSAVSVFGARQTSQPDSTFGASFSSDDVTSNITTLTDQCWIFDSIGDQSAAMAVVSPQTKLGTVFGDTGGVSYKTNVSMGANTMGWTWTGSETGRHDGAAYAPAPMALRINKLRPRVFSPGLGR